MKKIGNFKAKNSNEITGSKIGIGFECLDRQMWDDNDDAYRLAGELGVKHARVQTGWNRCEVVKGEFDFTWLDRIVDNLLEQGIQPWFNVGYGNIHHTEAEEPDAVGWAPIFSEESRSAWTLYVKELVKHFRDRVTHYEVWNEADIICFWNTGPNPDEYIDLLKLTVPVIKENQPNAKIIGGAIANGIGLNGFAILEEYLKLGMADLIDIYSIHRYHVHPELNRPENFMALRAAFDAYGGRNVELWQAESGCPSQSATTQALANTPVNEEIQAKVAARSIITDLSAGLDYTCYFHFSDFKFYYRNGYCDVPNHFGLITFDSPPRPKMSYFLFQRLCAIFDQDTKLSPRTLIDMGIENMSESKERYSFQTNIINAKFAAFERAGKPLVTWWLPENLLPGVSEDKPFEERKVDIYIWTPNENMKKPVVIDPMTGDIFEVESSQEKVGGMGLKSSIKLANVPLKDYPMIATDLNSVSEMINSVT